MTRARAGRQPDPGTQPGGPRTAPPHTRAARRHVPEVPRQRLVRSFVRDGRALRGRIGPRLTILPASDRVRRLVEVLAWDAAPDLAIAPAAS